MKSSKIENTCFLIVIFLIDLVAYLLITILLENEETYTGDIVEMLSFIHPVWLVINFCLIVFLFYSMFQRRKTSIKQAAMKK